ncbi:MAG: hypothetical protein CVV03_04045 [Firmicutes bacterium HGW-Firmicutes-8]|nr:MAG: hypothetical protein CVV03_04045 [Firmicutes bacterium HGW-Firmicutes-8]
MEVEPILGILSIPRANNNPFLGNQNESFTEILTVAERMNCVAFVFSPFDVDYKKNAVWGYRYNWKSPGGEWERRLYPLPSVIYNRIPNRTMENRENIKNLLSELKQKYGPRFFNPCFLDKWETHKILCNSKYTKDLLPETRKLDRPEVINEMLMLYDAVYLKPCANSLGNEIFKVCKKNRSQYYFIHQSLNQHRREGVVTHCSELVSELPQSEERTEYIVQQAIPLAKIGNRPFDLRLLVQKGHDGKWRKTGMAARIAGKESITTHVFYGGTRSPSQKTIRVAAQNCGFSIKKVKNQLKYIQSTVPKVIEKAYRASFGELEMDIAIDRFGKVWFLEANSKPFKFDEKLIRAKSLVRLIYYVRYLDSLQ